MTTDTATDGDLIRLEAAAIDAGIAWRRHTIKCGICGPSNACATGGRLSIASVQAHRALRIRRRELAAAPPEL